MKLNAKNLLMGVVIIIVLAFIVMRGDQLAELVETIKKGAALPLVIAVLTQLAKYFSQSFAYHFSFAAVGEEMGPRATLPLVFGTFFMNTVAPSLNLAGTTLVVDDARRRGIPPGKSMSAALLMQITVDSAFTCLMIIGFVILSLSVQLSPLWIAFGLIVVVLVCAMIGIMVLGNKKPIVVLKVLGTVERLVNKVLAKFNRKPLQPWAQKTVESFGHAAAMIAENPKTTAKAFGCSMIASLCELSCFCLVGVAFGCYSVQALVCGYVVATLFAMVSVTPQGVGVVEAAVTVAFTTFGETAAAGMAIALVYRGIVFWMPFLIGAILIQRTKMFKDDKDTKKLEDGETEAVVDDVSALPATTCSAAGFEFAKALGFQTNLVTVKVGEGVRMIPVTCLDLERLDYVTLAQRQDLDMMLRMDPDLPSALDPRENAAKSPAEMVSSLAAIIGPNAKTGGPDDPEDDFNAPLEIIKRLSADELLEKAYARRAR